MVFKIIKILSILVVFVIFCLTVLYIIGPYLIKNRFNNNNNVVLTSSKAKYQKIDALPKNSNILFITAHPDDLEFMAGGTLPYLLEQGNKVYLAILTNGGKQRYMPAFYSKRIIETRRKEQLAISKIEGVAKTFFFNNKDGFLKFDTSILDEVNRLADEIKATDIFTFEPGKRPGYYDSDHSAAGEIATALANKNDNIKGLYYFRASNPNIVIDITNTFDKKIDILFKFTEFKYKRRMLRAMHEAWAESDGKRIGVKYAEVFEKVSLNKHEETTGKEIQPELELKRN